VNGKRMAGCVARPSTGSIICTYKPPTKGAYALTAVFLPNSSSYYSSFATTNITVVLRTGNR
jgi:hypothetical protein